MADGLKDVVIARRLGLSPSTVGTHIHRIQQRLKLNDRDALVAWVAARRNRGYPEVGLRRGRDERVT